MMAFKFLIIDELHPAFLSALENTGCDADYLPDISADEIPKIIDNYEGLILRGKINVDSALIEKSSKLKIVARAGSGTEHIDKEALTKKRIILLASPEGNRDAVAEHAVGLLLSLLNKIHSADREIRENIWDRESNRGTELGKKTVALIGYGNTGKALAKRLKGFGCRVIAYDKYLTGFTDEGIEESTLETVFAEADILSLHVPLTAETQYLVSEAFLNRFKKPLWLINTSRGKIINTNDLVKAIKSEKILGAGLDVIEYEGMKNPAESDIENYDFLKNCEKVVMTPHTAGWSDRSEEQIALVLIDKINLTLKQAKF